MESNAARSSGCESPRAATETAIRIDNRVRRRRGWRILSLLLALIAYALPGCALHEGTVCDGSACPAIRPHVEIFRGLGGYMPGSGDLQERLSAHGICSSTWCNTSAHHVSRRILERRAQGDGTPIVLMGYAVGGKGARQVANDLAEHGVCVDAIILIDPSFFEPVPRNVRYCFVAYRPEVCQMWNPLMRGEPVRVESTHTVVNRMNLDQSAPPGVLDGECHLTITTNDWIQKLLVQQATAVFGSSDDGTKKCTFGCGDTAGEGAAPAHSTPF